MSKDKTEAATMANNLRAVQDCVKRAADSLPTDFKPGTSLEYVRGEMQRAQRLLRDCVMTTIAADQRNAKLLPEAQPISREEEEAGVVAVRQHKRRLKKAGDDNATPAEPTPEAAATGYSSPEMS